MESKSAPAPWAIMMADELFPVVYGANHGQTGTDIYRRNCIARALEASAVGELVRAASTAVDIEDDLSPCDEGCDCYVCRLRAALSKLGVCDA